MEKTRTSGQIHLILGPMFSGKTTELLRLHERQRIAGRECLLVKYAGDTRYDEDRLATHSRRTSDSRTLKARRLSSLVSALSAPNVDVVAIDEGQFFPDLSEVSVSLAEMGKVVYVAALDGDFSRQPFPSVSSLIPHADSFSKLLAVCTLCGEDAPFTHRLTSETLVEVIGGKDTYRALCRVCYSHSVFKEKKEEGKKKSLSPRSFGIALENVEDAVFSS